MWFSVQNLINELSLPYIQIKLSCLWGNHFILTRRTTYAFLLISAASKLFFPWALRWFAIHNSSWYTNHYFCISFQEIIPSCQTLSSLGNLGPSRMLMSTSINTPSFIARHKHTNLNFHQGMLEYILSYTCELQNSQLRSQTEISVSLGNFCHSALLLPNLTATFFSMYQYRNIYIVSGLVEIVSGLLCKKKCNSTTHLWLIIKTDFDLLQES